MLEIRSYGEKIMKNKNHNILNRAFTKIFDTCKDVDSFGLIEGFLVTAMLTAMAIIIVVSNDPLPKIWIAFILYVILAVACLGFFLVANRKYFTFVDEDNESDPILNNETDFTDTQDTAIEKICETTKYYYPEIEEKINKIDKKLEDGYVFSGMITGKWETVYKQEILDLMRSQYKISDENQQRILKLLKRLKKNMINKKEKEADFQAGVNIEAMERMADMDLVGGDFRIGETRKD